MILLLAFVVLVIAGLWCMWCVDVAQRTAENARLLRRILAHLDPEDPEGEP